MAATIEPFAIGLKQSGRWPWRFVLLGLVSLMLAACTSSKMSDMFNDAGVKGEQLSQQAASGRKVALLLPLTAPGETKRIAQAMKQAAELALTDTGGSGITLLTKDSGGSARSAGTSGIKIAAAQPYARGQSSAAAAQRIAQDVNDPTRGVDALLIPEGGEALRTLSGALEQSGITAQKLTVLGTGLWDDNVTRAT